MCTTAPLVSQEARRLKLFCSSHPGRAVGGLHANASWAAPERISSLKRVLIEKDNVVMLLYAAAVKKESELLLKHADSWSDSCWSVSISRFSSHLCLLSSGTPQSFSTVVTTPLRQTDASLSLFVSPVMNSWIQSVIFPIFRACLVSGNEASLFRRIFSLQSSYLCCGRMISEQFILLAVMVFCLFLFWCCRHSVCLSSSCLVVLVSVIGW